MIQATEEGAVPRQRSITVLKQDEHELIVELSSVSFSRSFNLIFSRIVGRARRVAVLPKLLRSLPSLLRSRQLH